MSKREGDRMAYIRIELEDGRQWGVSNTEVVIPASTLDGMNAEEIGAKVLELASVVSDFQMYLSKRPRTESFDSLEEFREEFEENAKKIASKQVRHSPNNETWQIDYEQYTLDDFREMLAEDSRLQLYRPHVRKAIEALIENTRSWGDTASALGLSIYTAKEKVRFAVYEFLRRQQNPSYQPRRLR